MILIKKFPAPSDLETLKKKQKNRDYQIKMGMLNLEIH